MNNIFNLLSEKTVKQIYKDLVLAKHTYDQMSYSEQMEFDNIVKLCKEILIYITIPKGYSLKNEGEVGYFIFNDGFEAQIAFLEKGEIVSYDYKSLFKKEEKILKYKKESIKVGDKVKIIDGSGLELYYYDEVFKNNLYIVCQYPQLTGIELRLKDIIGEVIEIDVKNQYSVEKSSVGRYELDCVVKLGNCKFRTCSKFVIKASEEKYF